MQYTGHGYWNRRLPASTYEYHRRKGVVLGPAPAPS